MSGDPLQVSAKALVPDEASQGAHGLAQVGELIHFLMRQSPDPAPLAQQGSPADRLRMTSSLQNRRSFFSGSPLTRATDSGKRGSWMGLANIKSPVYDTG